MLTEDRHCPRTSVIFAPERGGDTLTNHALCSPKNRRRSRRRWISVPVLIRHDGSRIEGHSINLSRGGMFLFAAAHLSPGTHIEIEFHPPGRKQMVHASGTVRRRALYLYAIEFLESGDGARMQDDKTSEIRV